jgi:hypothetical protein
MSTGGGSSRRETLQGAAARLVVWGADQFLALLPERAGLTELGSNTVGLLVFHNFLRK